ncbi:hypothetical protein WA588_000672, partial [Blastocystis sp. NMH]
MHSYDVPDWLGDDVKHTCMGTIVDTRNGYLSVRFYQPHSKRILFCSFCLSGSNTPCLLHRTVGVPFHPQSSSPLLRLCDYCIRTLGSHTYEFSTLKRSSSSKPSHRLSFQGNRMILWEMQRFGRFKQCRSYLLSHESTFSPSFRTPPVRNASTLLLMDNHRIVYSVTKLNHHLAIYYYDECSFLLSL